MKASPKVRLSLITAVHPPRSQHLIDTAKSVTEAQRLLKAEGHNLEWVVVIDGPGETPDVTGTPGLLRITRPMAGGVSAARNTGLAHVGGGHVMPLDHDDMVNPTGLLEVLSDPRFHEVRWVGANNQTLDGTWTSHRLLEPQLFEQYWLEEHWTSPFAFHPNCLIAQRDAVLSVGGWPALTGNQDVGMIFALNSRHEGWGLTPAITSYRHWDEQTIASPKWPMLKKMDFRFLGMAVNARRATEGLRPISVPDAGGRNSWPAP